MQIVDVARHHTNEALDCLARLIAAPSVPIGVSHPPSTSGVYAFSISGKIVYVGEAFGSGGLRDRIKRKHVAGDDGHALQKAFLAEFPDRLERRDYIKSSVCVQWVEIPDSLMVSLVEKLGILTLLPPFNSHVARRRND